ncbi:MAG: hypothetical protein E6Q95_02575 [Chitinophagaceae bacterium]|nr:MAG: hypothetical protein E6Q95_02575 [Chitinophagaceae bacterium]
MVKVFIGIVLISNAQHIPKRNYIMLDSLNTHFTVQRYTLKTKELYNIDKTIEVYNVPMLRGEFLLLISVLPSFTEKENWKKINFDSLKSQVFSIKQIKDYTKSIHNAGSIDFEYINSLKFGLIKKEGDDYYLSNICLLERFNVRNYPFPLITPYKTINTSGIAITIKDFQQQAPKSFAPMNPENSNYMLLDKILLENYYLSKKFIIKGDTAYQFWTFSDWMVADGWNEQRGIDRFVYIPGKGIVGGSYDFWFAFKPWREVYNTKEIPVKADKLWDNILNERVMLAEELK